MSNLRPSILPKIAACARYESDPVAGEAAERGTKIDVAFRAIIAGEPADQLAPEEAGAVEWAATTAVILAGEHPLESREDHLRIEACGLTGTADLLCVGGRWSADLKSGQKRNYREQQAAYALGFMTAHFEDEWTVYLIYCDEREVERLHYSRDEAESIVRAMIARGTDPQRIATPCDYCGWCAARYRCATRLEIAAPLVPVFEAENPESAFETILADNDKLGAFLKACKVVDDLNDRARTVAKERLIAGKADGLKIPGVSLVTKKGGQILPAEELRIVVESIGPDAVLALLKSVSREKAEKLFAEAGIEMPVEKIIETAGSCYVQVR